MEQFFENYSTISQQYRKTLQTFLYDNTIFNENFQI